MKDITYARTYLRADVEAIRESEASLEYILEMLGVYANAISTEDIWTLILDEVGMSEHPDAGHWRDFVSKLANEDEQYWSPVDYLEIMRRIAAIVVKWKWEPTPIDSERQPEGEAA